MDKVVVGIRFQKIGKLYHFDATRFKDIQAGDFAIVNTSRGIQLGQVVGVIEDPPAPPKGTWKRIERMATALDLAQRQVFQQKELEMMIECRAKASELKFEGLKIVSVEYSFDGKSAYILYNTEGEEEVDLSPLQKDIRRAYSDLKIEFRRIGPRDVAKVIGGMGACGMASRCCSTFLTEFSPISIKMAKAQGVSLDPSEITGMCGRLRCCLIYEYEQYVEARKELPKRGKRVVTPLGPGKVIDSVPLRQSVIVHLDEGDKTRVEFLKHELEPWDELEALRRKAEQPCEKHGSGECNCGRRGDNNDADNKDQEKREN